jgi:hypothetical protein
MKTVINKKAVFGLALFLFAPCAFAQYINTITYAPLKVGHYDYAVVKSHAWLAQGEGAASFTTLKSNSAYLDITAQTGEFNNIEILNGDVFVRNNALPINVTIGTLSLKEKTAFFSTGNSTIDSLSTGVSLTAKNIFLSKKPLKIFSLSYFKIGKIPFNAPSGCDAITWVSSSAIDVNNNPGTYYVLKCWYDPA